MMADEFSWNCTVCNLEIDDQGGRLYVSGAELHRRIDARQAWQSRHPGAADEMPRLVEWHAVHHGCRENEFGDYTIDVERIRTADQMQAWTRHLREKPWLLETDWDESILRHRS
jgi:hypothetical protein